MVMFHLTITSTKNTASTEPRICMARDAEGRASPLCLILQWLDHDRQHAGCEVTTTAAA